ncbi:LytTR family DNA-binding domain-containing protein [Petroclostridium sp. X23]|uniref:LytR/AlgR family response regulator transcription factor n=1 Tax=Petroclostridium sp. X23 TaxID=3045146 RepID=UPI0024AC9890|nr:LytTR family DNA-binding domain-containing protein [Petroclostridium sp. X23]WHH60765.1 LytTR family DNA-binding domain-containing protein [Petroclostridium sp. X23]
MKIALCDDNKQELLHINRLLDEYSSNSLSEDQMKVSSFTSSIALLAQLESGKHFDIFLLDVIMPGLNGIELATEIRNRDQVSKIIFLTTSPEFAVESYAVDAINYLLKPLQKDKFFSVLEKAFRDIRSDLQQYLIVKAQGNLSKVFFRELIYLEVIGRSLYLHQKGGIVIESNSAFSQVEAVLLKDKRFLKTHRSYIVNLDYIKNLSKDGLTTTSNLSIPVSRNAFKEVKQAYINYSFRVED